MPTYEDVETIQRLLTNTELTDAESHKLYNNLGLAHYAARKFRHALRAHREEKRICKRLVASNPSATHQLDLAMAYRYCGDAMLKLDRLVDSRHVIIDTRADVIRAASEQHRKGLMIARGVEDGGVAAKVEVQAACAAIAQSALALALETRDRGHFEAAAFACVEAALLAEGLTTGSGGIGVGQRESMLLGISINMGIALSGLGQRDKARVLLQAVAVRAKRVNDEKNLVRAVSNLAEEAGEEEDWELCERFVREWIRLAKKMDDEADEADALRKLACVLIERRRFEEAKGVLERAVELAGTREAREEARKFLNVVEGEIEGRREMMERLQGLEKEAGEWEAKGSFVEEAKIRMEAGNCAFELQRPEDVARLLGRYFVLVDEYGCNTGVTGIKDQIHNAAVANMGEAMWTMGKYEQAVKWATRELTTYGDEVAGQAQAWCNLGVYLDDFGKKESAVQALRKSIELAKEAGEEGVLKRAQNNLELVLALAANKPKDIDDAPELSVPTVEHVTASSAAVKSMHEGSTTAKEDIANDAESIIIDSTQPLNHRNKSTAESGIQGSRSHPSLGGTTAERSTGGAQRYVELASEYKAICKRRRHPPVTARNMVIASFRTLSSELLQRETVGGDGILKVDFSALFLNDGDISAIFETLSKTKESEQLFVDLRLNPLLTAHAYDTLDARIFSSPKNLGAIRMLDLSCAGVNTAVLDILGGALGMNGGLRNVTHLNLSKNGLGRNEGVGGGVGKIVNEGRVLRVLDLSLNCLNGGFWKEFGEVLKGGVVRTLDLHLNNRKVPTALLEGETEDVVGRVKEVWEKLKELEVLDVRACGGSGEVRRKLREVERELGGFRRIVTVSPAVLDDFS